MQQLHFENRTHLQWKKGKKQAYSQNNSSSLNRCGISEVLRINICQANVAVQHGQHCDCETVLDTRIIGVLECHARCSDV